MIHDSKRLCLAALAAVAISAGPTLACTADLDDDGNVGFTDLTQMLGGWGPCGDFPFIGCEEDVTNDAEVGFADLTTLLGRWGPCTDVFECPQPFADSELQQIGLEALGPNGPLNLTDDLYDRIERDVTAIRSEHGLEGYLHACTWVGREMLVGFDPKASLEDFEALNEFYCGSLVRHWSFGGGLLVFPCDMNIPALAAEYEAQTEVEYAEVNGIVGGNTTRWVPVILGDGVWQWTVTVSFLDCFDGCDCVKQFTFITTEEGDALLIDETPVQGPAYCPDEIPGPPTPDVVESWRQLCNY
jgi:hypothetical protein